MCGGTAWLARVITTLIASKSFGGAMSLLITSMSSPFAGRVSALHANRVKLNGKARGHHRQEPDLIGRSIVLASGKGTLIRKRDDAAVVAVLRRQLGLSLLRRRRHPGMPVRWRMAYRAGRTVL